MSHSFRLLKLIPDFLELERTEPREMPGSPQFDPDALAHAIEATTEKAPRFATGFPVHLDPVDEISGQVGRLNNLGNRLRVAGRAIEALACWRRALEVQPNFGMALCNRAKILADYARALEDRGEQALLLWVAHKEASAALAPTAAYTDVRDERNREEVKTLKEWIESIVDVERIAAEEPLAAHDTSATEKSCGFSKRL